LTVEDGLKRTIEWYTSTHTRKGYVDERLLMEHV